MLETIINLFIPPAPSLKNPIENPGKLRSLNFLVALIAYTVV